MALGRHEPQCLRRGAIHAALGAWQIVASGPAAVTLASGSVTAARAYALSLTTRGTTISAQINGVLVAAVTNRMYRYGPAGLGSLGYYPVLYPSFTVRYLPAGKLSGSAHLRGLTKRRRFRPQILVSQLSQPGRLWAGLRAASNVGDNNVLAMRLAITAWLRSR